MLLKVVKKIPKYKFQIFIDQIKSQIHDTKKNHIFYDINRKYRCKHISICRTTNFYNYGKTTYSYCERLVYSIEVSEITGEHAIIHIRDGAGGKSSAIPIPIEKLSNPIPSLHAFEKDIFPLGKYFIDVQYLGMQTTAEFNLIDSDNMCISEAMQPVVVRWINGEFTDGMLISGFQNIVDEKLIKVPFELTEKNIDKLNIQNGLKVLEKDG